MHRLPIHTSYLNQALRYMVNVMKEGAKMCGRSVTMETAQMVLHQCPTPINKNQCAVEQRYLQQIINNNGLVLMKLSDQGSFIRDTVYYCFRESAAPLYCAYRM